MKPCGQDILAREGAGRKPYSAGLCREYATGSTCLAFSLQLRCRRRACRPAGIQIELTHLVEEGFVANAQHAGRILAAPMRLLQSVGDGFHLCFILQAAHQRLETLLARGRSEEHTSELQSLAYLVCRLLLEKKKKNIVSSVVVDRNTY